MKRRTLGIQVFGLGSLLAITCSWIVNKSVAWMFVHFFFTWFYVGWACLVHTTELNRALADTLHALGR